jgi:hypothetical protein
VQWDYLSPPVPPTSEENTHVNVIRPVPALVPGSTPNVELALVQPDNKFWWFQIRSIDVQIIGVFHLGTVQFTAPDEQVNETAEMWKLRPPHSREQFFSASHHTQLSVGTDDKIRLGQGLSTKVP